MKILYVANCYPPNFIGGAELIAHRHALELTRLGHSIHVLAGDHSGEFPPLHDRSTDYEGIPVTRVSLSGRETSWMHENFRNTQVDSIFRTLLETFKPDVVHFHNLPGLSCGCIGICEEAGVPSVLTVHDHWGFCHRQTLTRPDGSLCKTYSACSECLPTFESRTSGPTPISVRQDFVRDQFARLSLLVSPSAYLLDIYKEQAFCPSRAEVIGNGVNLSQYWVHRPTSASPNVAFGSMCYLAKHKGIDLILKALSSMPCSNSWTYTFAGEGPMAEEIRDFMDNSPNGRNVRYIGKVEPKDTGNFYRDINVFVIASSWPENQPLTILEAMSSGCAVIGSQAGGCAELIADASTGFLFRLGDAVDLSSKIRNYIISPQQALYHGLLGRRRASAWSICYSAKRLASEYLKLLNR